MPTHPFVPTADIFNRRTAGCLLHPTSLPPERLGGLLPPCGNIGIGAYRYLDFLEKSGLKVWQMLPIGPTHEDGSPYQSWSSHGGNEKLICLKTLCEWGWLNESRLVEQSDVFGEVMTESDLAKLRLRAGHQFFQFIDSNEGQVVKQAFKAFLNNQAYWLEDFALFYAIRRDQNGRCWQHWPEVLKRRHPAALKQAKSELATSIQQAQFEQFAFFSQWQALHQKALSQNIALFGDIPIFVALDSVDVWARPEQFMLDQNFQPTCVAGVPPDYFSETGQHWGNPLYRWPVMQKDHFSWWKTRLKRQFMLFDLIRIDHFRGLDAYWSIPAHSVDARNGRWLDAPGQQLLQSFSDCFQSLPIVAENLGLITAKVESLRKQFSLPGMLVLQFGFDGQPQNINAPHYHEPMNIVYTGTHDNDTTRGWLAQLSESQLQWIKDYLNRDRVEHWDIIKVAMASVARMAIIPMQDWLGLDNSARMNTPGTCSNNWHWQFSWEEVPEGLCQAIGREVHRYDRLGQDLPFSH